MAAAPADISALNSLKGDTGLRNMVDGSMATVRDT